MSQKAEHVAIRRIVLGTLGIMLLFCLRELWVRLPEFVLVSRTETPASEEPLATAAPPPARTAQRSAPSTPTRVVAEPEVRRAYPVRQVVVIDSSAPIAAPPSRIEVTVPPGQWSRPIRVPDGFEGSITFTIGRMRIERNGVDLGIFYRKPSLQGEQRGRELYIVKADPFAMLDKTPRTVTFDRDTRSLRFSSLEKNGGTVVVHFRP